MGRMVILKTKNNQGFTLIECTIALLLLTIVLVGGMAFYFYSYSYFQTANHKRIAMQIANAKLEDLKNIDDYSSLEAKNNEHTAESVGGVSYDKYVYVSDGPENPTYQYKQVRVRVAWVDPAKSAPQEIVLDTYIAP